MNEQELLEINRRNWLLQSREAWDKLLQGPIVTKTYELAVRHKTHYHAWGRNRLHQAIRLDLIRFHPRLIGSRTPGYSLTALGEEMILVLQAEGL